MPGLHPQQYHALIALIHCVKRTEISLCLDPHSEQFTKAQTPPYIPEVLDPTDMFHPTLQSFQRLLHLLDDTGMKQETPLILPGNTAACKAMPRFQQSPALGELEREFPDSKQP